MATPEELPGNESPKNEAKEDSCHDPETLEVIAGLIRKGYRPGTDGWLRLLRDMNVLGPAASKTGFRLWKASGFPTITTTRLRSDY